MQTIQDIINQQKDIDKKIKEHEDAIRALKNKNTENTQNFIVELVKPYFNFQENHQLLPIDKNLFLKNPIIQYDYKRQEHVFYGIRHEFQGGKLTSSGRHDEIAVSQWATLSDEIKSGNFKKLQEKNAHFDYISTYYSNIYRAGMKLCEDESFILAWMKPTSNTPAEMILYAKNSDLETIQSYKEKISNLSIEPLVSERFRYSKAPHFTHLVCSKERFSLKTIEQNASFIVQFFGESAIDEIKTKIQNMKENKRTVDRAPQKEIISHTDIRNLKI